MAARALRNVTVSALLACAASMAHGASPALSESNPEPLTAAAVEAADGAWLNAEINGDYKFLEWFLAYGYESVDSSGAVLPRAVLIKKRRERGHSEEFAKAVRDWRAAHPKHASVRLFGDTAILTWVADDPSSKIPVYSCDIFIYQGGHWHAIYSQHSMAER